MKEVSLFAPASFKAGKVQFFYIWLVEIGNV